MEYKFLDVKETRIKAYIVGAQDPNAVYDICCGHYEKKKNQAFDGQRSHIYHKTNSAIVNYIHPPMESDGVKMHTYIMIVRQEGLIRLDKAIIVVEYDIIMINLIQ